MKSIVDFMEHDQATPICGVGYCMGGILLAAADILYPTFFKALSFVATPWDFHASVDGNFAEQLVNWSQDGLPKIKAIDYVPADWLQMIFLGVDPAQIARKFSAFADMNPEDEVTKIFIEVEDWLNNGADIPSPLLIESVSKWYIDNEIVLGKWRVGRTIIDARKIKKPCHVTVPQKDRIVPPQSAMGICQQLSNVTILRADTGHISLMMGRQARDILWAPLRDFFMTHCGM
jgi:poly(3-hydroxyalkanoate) synthetase